MIRFFTLCACWIWLCSTYVYANSLPDARFSSVKNMDVIKNIVVMGDSLSAAYKLAESDGWVAMLQRRIDEHKLPYRIINGSISGATTSAGLQRLPSLIENYSPAIILLELGANDGLQGMPISGITHNLARLIEMGQVREAQVMLLGIQLPPNFGSRYTQPFFEQYQTLAAKYSTPFLPFLLEGVAGNEAFMQSDGLHPNAKGQPLILENVWQVLQPILNGG